MTDRKSEDDSEAKACQFCGGKMIRGHIWVRGGDGGVPSLGWQKGTQLRKGFFGNIKVEATLLKLGGVNQALRCYSCGALLTDFTDPIE